MTARLDRETLVLVPGLNCTADLFAAQTAALSSAGDILIADNTKHASIAGMAQDILDSIPGAFSLAGLSMGGYVALEIIRRAPERIARLALLDTSAAPDSDEARERRMDLIALAETGHFADVHTHLWPRLVGESARANAELEQRVLKMMYDTGADVFVRQQYAIINRPDARPNLQAIRVPTLVLVGEEDIITPVKVAESMAASINGATLVRLKDAGHLTTMERPDAVNTALARWLRA